MAEMLKIDNLQRLIGKLRGRTAEVKKDVGKSVIVGYTAEYAIYVHENMEMKLKGQPRESGIGVYWGPHGQPKFLEGPVKRLKNELAKIISSSVKKVGLVQAMFLAGLRLQKESQELVPVEYGNLKASAFTRIE